MMCATCQGPLARVGRGWAHVVNPATGHGPAVDMLAPATFHAPDPCDCGNTGVLTDDDSSHCHCGRADL